MNRSLSLITAVLLVLISASGCIVPPRELKPSVIPATELELVSAMKRGQDYAQGGRPDLAEAQFRAVLQTRPDLLTVNNDLGYALLAQDRPKEAIASFQQTLNLSPSAITPRLNLGKALYRDGQYQEALKQYAAALSWHEQIANGEVSQAVLDASPETRKLSATDLAEVYRDMSIIYYKLGELDNALSYSEKAVAGDASSSQIGNHVRLLLNTAHVDQAYRQARKFVAAAKDKAPPSLLLDYAVGAYLVGQHGMSKEAFQRVLGAEQADTVDRDIARLGYLMITQGEKKQSDAAVLSQAFVEDNPDICGTDILSSKTYFPDDFRGALTTLIMKLCEHGSDKSFF